ncbi:MAG: DEAD/DEAH box helicase family protein [Clostridia bacterium]|nr:DEAD/DEAH box helicase family protein [Clostridia bacterium]
MIYAYTTPEIARHDGWTKIGYTDKQTVEDRVLQQGHTIDVQQKIEWKGSAVFDDGSGETFTDHDFRGYLRKLGVEIKPKTEWCCITPPAAKTRFFEYRMNRGVLEEEDASPVIPYSLRVEQEKCAQTTADYYRANPNGEFLWNCKPRFGKTLTVYDFVKRVGAQRVLIVTNRPAIANSWYSDYEKFLGTESHYFFVSAVDGIKGKPHVLSYEQYDLDRKSREKRKQLGEKIMSMGLIDFVSLQDLKGAIEFGGQYAKLEELAKIKWDVLVIDEAHEGIDTYRTDVAFDHIKRNFTLHLSGTPFKALANDKFPEKAIFNWTYADEQRAKRDWDGEGSNPYATLPRLNLFTYQMSEIIRDELSQGVEIQGETKEYAFDLNEFFATNGTGRFVYESSVDRFLEALTMQEKFPFSTPELRDELRHTFWLLNRVDSARALAKKLEKHPVFSKYKVVLAAGDGRQEEDDARETQKSFDRVKGAIQNNEYTITLSVGQLTTGVTIPEWTAVLMLSSVRSPALYMQAAFRAQNPCTFYRSSQYFRKENAYVFDFDPARTLTIYEQFANDLLSETSDGRGDIDQRKENIRNLLNFFPVLGEDETGEMVELQAETVLSIPRKIRCQEVVRRGFMSDFLFQNVANVFHAPQAVLDIITQFTPVVEPKAKVEITPQTADELSLDENGEVNVDEDIVIGKAQELFGEKIYETVPDLLNDAIAQAAPTEKTTEEEQIQRLKDIFHQQAVAPLLTTAQEQYGADIRPADKKRLERKIEADSERIIHKAHGEFSIAQKKLEQERKEMLSLAETEEDKRSIEREIEAQKKAAADKLIQTIQDAVPDFVEHSGQEIVRTVETAKREAEKKTIETQVKDHLRGFSRTIPSFLMAYGDDSVTLATFDQIIPDKVFLEVTSITLAQFVFLRDGGDYTDEATGKVMHFDGHLFDPVVFDDSVREFLRLRVKLADYFEESSTENIFDYVPPQKTNQIFTPKWVVKKMVDLLEEENPGCFDQPDKTFADLYMKSGLYITEIVTRLYQSEGMKRAFPNRDERLRHIFAKQVYGLAPTEIIYKIATNFILGFDQNVTITEHHFRLIDALEYAKAGTLEEELDRVFGK